MDFKGVVTGLDWDHMRWCTLVLSTFLKLRILLVGNDLTVEAKPPTELEN